MEKIEVEVSVGELLDKISILEIKNERIKQQEKLINVQKELESLMEVKNHRIEKTSRLDELFSKLKEVNESLWEIEDKIRDCERNKNFGPEFVSLARSVYIQNDKRCSVKREINEIMNSSLIEEKSYAEYLN